MELRDRDHPIFWRVIEFWPDQVRGERVNVGVMAFGDGQGPRFRWLNDWSRVIRFARDSGWDDPVAILEHGRCGVEEDWGARSDLACYAHSGGESPYSVFILRDPMPSLRLSVEELVEEIAKTFLVEPLPETQ